MLPSRHVSESHEDGFTLIELLVVIIIIGILAAIAIPLFLDQRKLAVDASVKADVRNTVANIQTWQTSDEANRTKVEANTGTYVADGGKIAQTPGNSIGVSIDASGAATVCAYNAGGKTYLADSTAYVFNPATGQFTTGACVASSTTGGTATSGTSGSGAPAVTYPLTGGVSNGIYTSTFETGDSTNGMWSVGSGAVVLQDKTRGHGGSATSVAVPQVAAGSYAQFTANPTLTVGKSYTITAWVYNVGAGRAKLLIREQSGSGTFIEPISTKSGEWEQLTATFTPASTTPLIRAAVGPTTGSSTSSYFDDVVITPNN